MTTEAKAEFLTPLDVRRIGPRTSLVLDDFQFMSLQYRGIFVVPRGFQTDFASIPRLFFVRFPPLGLQDWAAVVHDAAYGNALVTPSGQRIFTVKAVADNLFLEGMLARGVDPDDARWMYRAVHIFGTPAGHPLAKNRPRSVRYNDSGVAVT